MALLYKGYAQERGTRPITIPDPSGKIRQQGLDQMRGMERVIEWNKSQADLIAKQFKDNAKFQKENREANWKLKEDFRDTVQEARRAKQERILNNHRQESLNAQQGFKDLLNMTQSGAKLLSTIDQKLKEDAQLWAKQWYEDDGITSKEFNAVREVEDHIWDKSKTELSVWRDLRKRGVSEDKIEQMRRMGGYRKIAVQKLYAVQMMQDRGSFYEKNGEFEVKILGRTTTLNAAIDRGDTTEVREVLRLLDQKAIKEYGSGYPSARILKSSGALAIKEEHKNAIFERVKRNSIKRNESRKYDDELEILRAELKNTIDLVGTNAKYGDSGKAVQGWIDRIVGHNPTRDDRVHGTDWAVQALIHGVGNDLISYTVIEDLLKSKIIPHGSTKEVIWKDYFHRHRKPLETALAEAREFEDQKLNAKLSSLDVKAKQFHLDITTMDSEDDYIPNEVWAGLLPIAKEHASKSTFGQRTVNLIVKKMSDNRNEENDSVWLARIKTGLENNRYYTDPEIDTYNMSNEARQQAKKMIREASLFLPAQGSGGDFENLKDFVQTTLEGIIPQGNSLKSATYTRGDAEKEALNRAISYYKTAKMSKNPEHNTNAGALKYAKDMLAPELQDPEGLWGRSTPEAGSGVQFKGFQTDPSAKRIQVDYPRIQRELSVNPGAVKNIEYIDKAALVAKLARLNAGRATEILGRASLISHASNGAITPLEAERAQLQYHGLDDYPEWYVKANTEKEDWIHPLQRQYLCTPGAVNKAVCANPNIEKRRTPVYTTPVMKKIEELDNQPEDENTAFLRKEYEDAISGIPSPFGLRGPAYVNDFTRNLLLATGFYNVRMNQGVA